MGHDLTNPYLPPTEWLGERAVERAAADGARVLEYELGIEEMERASCQRPGLQGMVWRRALVVSLMAGGMAGLLAREPREPFDLLLAALVALMTLGLLAPLRYWALRRAVRKHLRSLGQAHWSYHLVIRPGEHLELIGEKERYLLDGENVRQVQETRDWLYLHKRSGVLHLIPRSRIGSEALEEIRGIFDIGA